MTGADLDAPARDALAADVRNRLVTLGAHPYLVFMAQLRLRMVREPQTFEHF